MPLPPLLSSRPPAMQIVVANVVPCLFGAVCGLMLGVHEGVYLVLALPIATLGGFVAGLEHRSPGEGAARGALGGVQFGALLVAVHDLSGLDAKAEIPDPAILLVVVTTVLGAVLGLLGGMTRERRARAAGGQ